MKTNKLFKTTTFCSYLLALGILTTSASYAATFAGNATPTNYTVNLQQVSFHRVGAPVDAFASYASGSGAYDIAAATVGTPVGTLQSNGALGSGSYDQMRFEVSKTMNVTASYAGSLAPSTATTCRTMANATAINDPLGDGSVSVAYLGSTDGGVAQEATIMVPTGSAVTLPAGYVDTGSNIQGTVDIAGFTVADGEVPASRLNIDVTNSVMFVGYGASGCIVFPGPPVITPVIG